MIVKPPKCEFLIGRRSGTRVCGEPATKATDIGPVCSHHAPLVVGMGCIVRPLCTVVGPFGHQCDRPAAYRHAGEGYRCDGHAMQDLPSELEPIPPEDWEVRDA